ncbi:Ribosome maturation factor RimM [Euphorbia peplus]|nr:Ribosome maturation factor RimM [Euphorbia peplus]
MLQSTQILLSKIGVCDFAIPGRVFPVGLPYYHRINDVSPLRCRATQGIAEKEEEEAALVEVGYLSSVHGLHGEICAKPITDFPEFRFSKPGIRWLRQPLSGKLNVLQLNLLEGRGHHGRKTWILRFGGIDSVDQAKQLVGSTILVKEEDRPQLEEGEFYSRDLLGMTVNLKETGESVGTVVNVFDSGGNDLLQVMLYPQPDGPGKSMTEQTGLSGPLVWVPFVEAIVPDVDMIKREMWITPPKGLLELNIRSDDKSKKERRQLEWKERKKIQRRLISAKKKLSEMEQKHVFNGLRYGEKFQRSLLADQIVGVNSKLLQQALQNFEKPSKRWSVTEVISAAKTNLIKNSLPLSDSNFKEKGLHLLSKGKLAIILVLNDIVKNGRGDSPESSEDFIFSFIQKSLTDEKTFLKMEDRASVPLVFVSSVEELQSLKMTFSNNDYFGFDSEKVWFWEEEKLPVVNSSAEEQSRHQILMKTPWEILQSPVGSGGVFSLLSSHNILENFSEAGVEYIEVCSLGKNSYLGNAPVVGYVNSCRADIGIQILEDVKDSEEGFDMIFSIDFMKSLIERMDKLQFHAIPKANSYVEMADKEWVDVIPSSDNSYQFHCSIYSSLNACALDKICVMKITE